MKKVLILLSTYNGERFLLEQLESIVAQKGVETWVLVRDDGSNDATVEILRRYSEKNPRVDVRVGENKGYARSFIELMRIARAEYIEKVDFFGFADQDDVWKLDKLERAAKHLADCDFPALYLSDVMMVDSGMRALGKLVATPSKLQGVAYDFVDCFVLGCTFVFNVKLLDLVVRLTKEQVPPSHDRMVYLIARSLGKIIADANCTMLYRQHGCNVCGGARSENIPMMKRLRKLFYHKSLIYEHLKVLEPIASAMRNEDATALMALLFSKRSLTGRISVVLHWRKLGFARKTCFEDIKKKIKILMGVL